MMRCEAGSVGGEGVENPGVARRAAAGGENGAGEASVKPIGGGGAGGCGG